VEMRYRFTHALGKENQTMVMDAPSSQDHPAIDLIHMLGRLRDSAALACSYFQPIPPNATLLFADPHRRIERVWAKGDEVRAVIVTARPGDGAEPAGAAADGEAAAEWYAYEGGRWVKSKAPPEDDETGAEAATQPTSATGTSNPSEARPAPALPTAGLVPQNLNDPLPPAPPATVPAPVPLAAVASGEGSPRAATAAVPAPEGGPLRPPAASSMAPGAPAAGATTAPATEPSRFSNPGMLQMYESWSAEPGATYTTVWHLMPMSPVRTLKRGFVVPAFVFDDEHMSIDVGRQTLYLIHDGQLFKLPMPPIAFSAQ